MMSDPLSGAGSAQRATAPDRLTTINMTDEKKTEHTEEEIDERMHQVGALSSHLLRACETWAEAQIVGQGRDQIGVLAEVCTAALQVGLLMSARMNLPAEKITEMYAAEQEFVKEEANYHDPNCPDCAKVRASLQGTPDPKAN
jgi:hypothetical protein